MTDHELLDIYETTYKEEFENNFEIATKFSAQARDKKYALELGLGVIVILLTFRKSSEIEREIMQTFEHNHKLGCSIIDTIHCIPDIIDRHKSVATAWHARHKNETFFTFKRFLGLIPYSIESIHMKPSIRIGSPFEDLTTLSEISSELARQRAVIDVVEQLKGKYIEIGGTIDSENSQPITPDRLSNLKCAISGNDLDTFFKIFQEVFASMAYDMKVTEGYFQGYIHLVLKLVGIKILSELETNKGRIDSVVETENYLYIIEFKEGNSSTAIEQIKAKQYYQPFFSMKKKVVLVGVAVNYKEKNITDWKIQPY